MNLIKLKKYRTALGEFPKCQDLRKLNLLFSNPSFELIELSNKYYEDACSHISVCSGRRSIEFCISVSGDKGAYNIFVVLDLVDKTAEIEFSNFVITQNVKTEDFDVLELDEKDLDKFVDVHLPKVNNFLQKLAEIKTDNLNQLAFRAMSV